MQSHKQAKHFSYSLTPEEFSRNIEKQNIYSNFRLLQVVPEQKQILEKNGYCIIDSLYSDGETGLITEAISKADLPSCRSQSSDSLFAIRKLFAAIPDLISLVFTEKTKSVITSVAGPDYFVTKAIYFDKPPKSNWFVPWHQDITISVDEKKETTGYSSWTFKQEQYGVQPPVQILQNCFTLRIHLDNTDEHNGALRVLPGSHQNGIIRKPNTNQFDEGVCQVNRGGAMLMKPLLLHSSKRSINGKQRRVIHIEFSNQQLANGLNWAEQLFI